jgi:hypothetical protein
MYVEELVTKTNQQLHLLMIMCSCLGTLGVWIGTSKIWTIISWIQIGFEGITRQCETNGFEYSFISSCIVKIKIYKTIVYGKK